MQLRPLPLRPWEADVTALCGGGTSGAKPAASAVTLVAAGFAALVLDKYGAGWLKWVIPFLSLPELTLSTFCGSDPPAIPVFTAAESAAILHLTFNADFNSGLSKLSDLVAHLAWYELCQCNTGSLSALPAAPAPPSGTPVWTPAAPQNATACSSVQFFETFDNTTFPGSNVSAWPTTFPPGVTACRITATVTVSIAPGPTVGYQLRFTAGDGTTYTTTLFTLSPGDPTRIADFVVPLRPVKVEVIRWAGSAAGRSTSNEFIDLYCNGLLPGGTVGVCGPDVATQLSLEAILRMVTLLQRQLVPFATINSTAHSGLSGTGSFAVQGLLGVRIDLTTVPSSVTQDASTPPFFYNVGWVSMSDANGFVDETRAHGLHQNWFSRIASEATLVGYSFAPGVIATITELQREPQ